MIRIIDGKRYDTETATSVAVYENKYPSCDFRWFMEELYKTQKGSYFLYVEGGALSPYSEPCGNNGNCGISDIKAMSPKEAFEWMTEHGLDKKAEKEFSEMIEDA